MEEGFREATNIIQEIRGAYKNLSSSNVSSSSSSSSNGGNAKLDGLTKKLATRLESIALRDPGYGSEKDVDQLLWKFCYYKRIEKFRAQIKKLKTELAEVEDTESKFVLKQTLRRVTGDFLHFLDQSRDRYVVFLYKLQDALRLLGTEHQHSLCSIVEHFILNCFMHLGDLARYREMYDDTQREKTYSSAERFYKNAIRWDPNMGAPHNQLAVLAQYTDKTCVSLYQYIFSLQVESPFPTTKDNLRYLFKYNRGVVDKRRLLEPSPTVLSAPMNSKQRAELLRDYLTRFVHLIGLFLGKDPDVQTVEMMVHRMNDETPILLRTWALTKQLQLAIMVCSIHAILKTRRVAEEKIKSLAEAAALQFCCACLESMRMKDGSLGRLDLLIPVSIFLVWLRTQGKRLEENGDSIISICNLQSISAKRLWNDIDELWNELLLSAEQTADSQGECILWEERELLGFKPLKSKEVLFPKQKQNFNGHGQDESYEVKQQGVDDGGENENEESQEFKIATGKRSRKVWYFCDYIVNACGLREIFSFQPPPIISKSQQTFSSQKQQPQTWGIVNEKDKHQEEEEEEEEEEVIVLAPQRVKSPGIRSPPGFHFAVPPDMTSSYADADNIDATLDEALRRPLDYPELDRALINDDEEEDYQTGFTYSGIFPDAMITPNTFVQSSTPSPPNTNMKMNWPSNQNLSAGGFHYQNDLDQLVSPSDFMPYLPQTKQTPDESNKNKF